MKKTAAILFAAGTLALSGAAFAATDAPAPRPLGGPAYGQNVNPKIAMADAVATAEKAYGGQSRRAQLRGSHYGLVWDVLLQDKDGKMISALVDADSGKIKAAFDLGNRSTNGYGCPFGPMGPRGHWGMGPGMMGGRGCY